jgi:hypothetical protein
VYLLYISNYSRSGLAFSLSWQLTAGASLDCTVLPVEFLTVNAVEEGTTVVVDWSTATEHNSDYYTVERSADGEHFQAIGTVEAAGESQHLVEYTYTDRFPLLGNNYYRLKQVDLDGAYERTDNVMVVFGNGAEAPKLFPNPVKDVLNIAFQMPLGGTAYAQLVDATGRVVRDRDQDLDRGPQTMSIGTSGLVAGAYEVRLFTSASGTPISARFIKE